MKSMAPCLNEKKLRAGAGFRVCLPVPVYSTVYRAFYNRLLPLYYYTSIEYHVITLLLRISTDQEGKKLLPGSTIIITVL